MEESVDGEDKQYLVGEFEGLVEVEGPGKRPVQLNPDLGSSLQFNDVSVALETLQAARAPLNRFAINLSTGSAPMCSGSSLRSIDVPTVPDTENDDFLSVIVDSVEDAVGAASSAPHALQLVAKRGPYWSRVVEQRARDEVDYRKRHGSGIVSRIARAADAATTISYRDSVTGAGAP